MGYYMKIVVQIMGYPSTNNCSGVGGRAEVFKTTWVLLLTLVTHHNNMVRSYCLKHHTLCLQDTEKSNLNQPRSFLSPASFHSAERCSASHLQRNKTNGLTDCLPLHSVILHCLAVSTH